MHNCTIANPDSKNRKRDDQKSVTAMLLTIDPVNNNAFDHGNHEDAEPSTVVVHQL